jgi:hypothetical protein
LFFSSNPTMTNSPRPLSGLPLFKNPVSIETKLH